MDPEDIEKELRILENDVEEFELPEKMVITQPEITFYGRIVRIKRKISKMRKLLERYKKDVEFFLKISDDLNEVKRWVEKCLERLERAERKFRAKLLNPLS